MDQQLTPEKITLQQQIDFVRGARHLVSSPKREICLTEKDYRMLMAIEENLIAVKLLNMIGDE